MKIAIFASGTGSNALKIIAHLATLPDVQCLILSNKANAPILAKAQTIGIETFVFTKTEFYEQTTVVDFLKAQSIQFIVLAGFLWLVPPSFIAAFPKAIINLHPALLPKFGGKGMYGMRVHEAVKAANEMETGITIHYVNEKYDEGEIILQARCPIATMDTPESIAQKVQALEHLHLPEVVKNLVALASKGL